MRTPFARRGQAKAEILLIVVGVALAAVGFATVYGGRIADSFRRGTAALDGNRLPAMQTPIGGMEDDGGGGAVGDGTPVPTKKSGDRPGAKSGATIAPLSPAKNPLNPPGAAPRTVEEFRKWAGITDDDVRNMERGRSSAYAMSDRGPNFCTDAPFTPWSPPPYVPARPASPTPPPASSTNPPPDSPETVNPPVPANPTRAKTAERHFARNKHGKFQSINRSAVEVANRHNPDNRTRTGGGGVRRQTGNLTKYGYVSREVPVAHGKTYKFTGKGAAGAETKATGEARTTGNETIVRGEIGTKSGVHGEANGAKFIDFDLQGQRMRAQIDGKVEGLFGAEAKTSGLAQKDKRGGAVYGKAEVFSGAKGGASAGVRLFWYDPGAKKFVEVGSGTLLAEGGAGAGASVEFRLGYKDRKFKFRAGASAFVGLGGGARIDGMLDAPAAYRFGKTVAQGVPSRAWSAVKRGVRGTGTAVRNWLRRSPFRNPATVYSRRPSGTRTPLW